jgi:hypothetical protein
MAPDLREQRLVFGEDAELYDKARAGYPESLLDDVLAFVGVEDLAGAGAGGGGRYRKGHEVLRPSSQRAPYVLHRAGGR